MNPQFESVNKQFEASFRNNWNLPAVSNYGGETISYGAMAGRIESLHILFEKCGVVPGDKIAICGRNQANWAVSFLSVLTYGAVPVPILHEFTPESVHHIVGHSGSKILFVGENIWPTLDEAQMPDLEVVVRIDTLRPVVSRTEKVAVDEDVQKFLAGKYPEGFKASDMNYYEDGAEELAIINYTSGTSGFSKGVMLPYRSLWSNIYFAKQVLPQLGNTSKIVSMLPSAHMYGLMFEVLYELSCGVHVYFLTRIPSPKIILQAMAEVKPTLVVAVPLIIEKIYKNMLQPILNKKAVSIMMKCVPGFKQILLAVMRKKLIAAFGGNFIEVIIGGAAFNKEVEAFFHSMHFPFTVGYGMTECAPIITYAPWDTAKVGSSGYAAHNMELKIDSTDPQNVPGEILCKGANVFQGYYNNPEATAACFTEDGWFRTGDMGVIDSEGYLFIKGRSKCMILTSNGQNVYPEEIETVINNLPYVIDSLAIDDNGMITSIIYADFQKAEKDGIAHDQLQKKMEALVAGANKIIPNYANVKKVELIEEDFQRTPKKSIKRYLYQR